MNKNARPMVASTLRRTIITILLALVAMAGQAQEPFFCTDSAVDPESLNYDYYMSQPFTPDNEWKFSNEPYKRAIESGKAQLKIHVTKIPKELTNILPNASARVQNQITGQEENSVVPMDENNCYILDLNIPHAQFVTTQPFGNVFIAPGDTIEMFSTIDSAPDGSEPRFKTFRSNSESAMINTLLPSLVEPL